MAFFEFCQIMCLGLLSPIDLLVFFCVSAHREQRPFANKQLYVFQPQQTFRFAEKMVLQGLCNRGLAMVQTRSAAAVATYLRHAAVDDVLRPGMGDPRQC